MPRTVNTNGTSASARQAGRSNVAVKPAGLDFKEHHTKKLMKIYLEKDKTLQPDYHVLPLQDWKLFWNEI